MMRRRARWAGLVGSLATTAALMLGSVVGAPAAAAATGINGGGSSFAAPEINQWTADVAHPPASLSVNYAGSSSGAGRDDYAQGYYAYGASDIVYYANDQQFATEAQSQHPFKYVTVSAGGLAFMYNIVIGGQRWTGLQLTQQEACQIFTGQLTNWTQLASTPGDAILAGVNEPITTVQRTDPAGESYVLSQYCIAVDQTDWSTFVNYVESSGNTETGSGWPGDADLSIGKPVENWPTKLEDSQTNNNIGANGATEEVNDVTNSNAGGYSIGYMATAYAVTAGYPVASVQNAAGQFVQPNATSVQDALAYASANAEGTFDLSFSGSNPAAYFPSTYSYIIAPVTTNAPTSAGADATLAQFLCYSVGEGQSEAARLRYAPLSSQVTALSVSAIEAIPGAPPAASCGTGGPAPVVSTPAGVTPAASASPGAAAGSTSGAAGSSAAKGTTAIGGTTAAGSSTAAGATTTTVAGSTAAAGSSTSGAAGEAASQTGGVTATTVDSSPTSVEVASSNIASTTTNSEAYWWLALGAIICAVGVLGVSASKGARR
jgi:phosphate transport system substrate-binding protein